MCPFGHILFLLTGNFQKVIILFTAFLRCIIMKRIMTFILFMLVAYSCEKEYHTTIPNVEVRFDLKLNSEDFELNTDLAYKTFTQKRLALDRLGFGGLLVINGMGDLYAFDLSCPVEAQRNIHVIPDNLSSPTSLVPTAVTATCPICGAVFTIATGTGAPQSGTKYYLRSYRVVGSGIQCTVTN